MGKMHRKRLARVWRPPPARSWQEQSGMWVRLCALCVVGLAACASAPRPAPQPVRPTQTREQFERALQTRAELAAYLVSIGANARPPMPPPRAEEEPDGVPFDGAVWLAGHWVWSGSEWQWIAGAWADRNDLHERGVEANDVQVHVHAGVKLGN
jgi:hypothetical protein